MTLAGKELDIILLYTMLSFVAGPSSLRSSNTNSPVTVNPSLDALEGQFRNTPGEQLGTIVGINFIIEP